jgi:hypothetical protein
VEEPFGFLEGQLSIANDRSQYVIKSCQAMVVVLVEAAGVELAQA